MADYQGTLRRTDAGGSNNRTSRSSGTLNATIGLDSNKYVNKPYANLTDGKQNQINNVQAINSQNVALRQKLLFQKNTSKKHLFR
jgi:hypothetical protein